MTIIDSITSRAEMILARRRLAANFKKLACGHHEQPKSEKPLKFGFLTTPGTFGSCCDLLLALLLKKCGHETAIICVDQSFPLQEIHHKERPLHWEATTKKNLRQFRKLAKCAGIGFIEARTLDFDFDEKKAPCEIDSIVKTSLLRHYRVGELTTDLPDYERRKEMMRTSAMQSAKTGAYFSHINRVDRLIMNHGLYATTGPARLVALDNSVPLLTYDRAKRKGCFNFSWANSSDRWDISDVWEREKSSSLTKAEADDLDSYLDSRISHSEDVYRYNSIESHSEETLRKTLGVGEKKVCVLFTNVLWDAASSERDLIFSSPIDWVTKTIDIASRLTEQMHLVIRIHPAELVIGTEQSFESVLKKRYPILPDNLTILPPDSDINSWSLNRFCDLGLVHTTTAGLELALSGKPVVVASDTHYRGKGFTLEPATISEYAQLLQQIETQRISDKQISLARKYAYLSFIRYQFKFPFITMGPFKRIHCNVSNLSEILTDNQFKHLLNCLEQKEVILNPENNF